MINFSDELGQRTWERINSERVIWLTSVSSKGIPQPRPVWFILDNGDFIIYSSARAKKLAHIADNPNVALNFNAGADGYDVQVILGKARVDKDLPPSNLHKAYSEKYGAEISTLDMDEKKYADIFCIGIRITPIKLRGLEPIPDIEQDV